MSLRLIVDGVPTTVPDDWEPFTRTRRDERWTWRWLDDDDNVVRDHLPGVEGGHLTFNAYADTRGTGRLKWSGLVEDMPYWRGVRVQAVYTATLEDRYGTRYAVEWPAGVFICSAPEDAHGVADVEVDVELFDKTLILRRAHLTQTYSLAAGTNVVSTVRTLLADYVTGTPAVIEDSTATLRSAMTWDPDTSIFRVVNDLLDAIGYYGIWADGDGVLRSSLYERPQDRELAWAFVGGSASIVSADMVHDHDDFDTPNRVTLISRADGDQTALTSTISVDDLDTTHPLAHAVTGEWVDRTEKDVEAADQATLDAMAERMLVDGLSVVSTYHIEHAPIPVPINARVHLRRGTWLNAYGVVQEVTFDCATGADFKTRVREVVGA